MFLKICLLIFCMILPRMAWNVYNRNTDHQQEMRYFMAKPSIYAVARGRACGLFTSWQECEKQIKGYPGARYKGFADVAAALAWLNGETNAATGAPQGSARRAPSAPAAPRPRPPRESCAAAAPTVPADYTIYTDGSCLKNPGGPGGWAIVACDERTGTLTEKSGGHPETTNNRMELTAAIEALAFAPADTRVALYTDSQYLKNGLTKWLAGWKRRGWKKADGTPVLNRDLWEQLDALTHTHVISYHWVKGHRGNPRNERCDTLARGEAMKFCR